MRYHAVMLDETGCEFGHTFDANNREDAWDYLDDMFPESRCVQLEDPDDTAAREKRTYDHAWSMAYDDDYAYINDEY